MLYRKKSTPPRKNSLPKFKICMLIFQNRFCIHGKIFLCWFINFKLSNASTRIRHGDCNLLSKVLLPSFSIKSIVSVQIFEHFSRESQWMSHKNDNIINLICQAFLLNKLKKFDEIDIFMGERTRFSRKVVWQENYHLSCVQMNFFLDAWGRLGNRSRQLERAFGRAMG